MELLHKKQSLLLSQLLETNESMTSYQLSLSLGVSVRTVKTYIQVINEYIMPFGMKICSQPGEGYWLEKEDHVDMISIYGLMDKNIALKYNDIPKYNYERINYIIKKLLVVDYPLKIENLMDEIFVSRSTLTADLKEVRKLLAKFHLKVISRANYGIVIEGSEIDKRLCICEYFFHNNQKFKYTIDSENMFNTGKNKKEYNQIVDAIQDVCTRFSIDMSDFSLNNLAIHISIGMRRCMIYNYVKVEDNVVVLYQDTVEFQAATALVKYLEWQFHCMLPIGETIYYAMHFQSKRIKEENKLNHEEERKLTECLHIILSEITNNFELDFEHDQVLYQYLYMHIPLMIQRLQNHMVIRNPLVHDNLRRYLFATKVTHSAVAVIEQMYNIAIDINEFGYLLLYFNMAIMSLEHKKKIRIGFVSGRGRPESIMYLNEIRENLPQDRFQVIAIDKNDLLTIDVDFLITTYTINQTFKTPVYLIKNDLYLNEIREQLNHLQYMNLDFENYFKKEYCFFNMLGTTKEDVLQNLYHLFYKRGYINDIPQYNQRFKDDELGNGIVHFQDLYRIIRKEMCFFIVLKHSVLWDKDIVRVLIITKTKKYGDKDLPALCRLVSRWANRADKVEQLITNQDFDSLIYDLKED